MLKKWPTPKWYQAARDVAYTVLQVSTTKNKIQTSIQRRLGGETYWNCDYVTCVRNHVAKEIANPAPGLGFFPCLPGARPPCWSCPGGCNLRTGEGMQCDGDGDKDGYSATPWNSWINSWNIREPLRVKPKDTTQVIKSFHLYSPIILWICNWLTWSLSLGNIRQPIDPSGKKHRNRNPPFPRGNASTNGI